jgi:tRNA pseudouridine38-40 synthase
LPSIALLVQYDGRNYFGFQKQNNFPSIQESLEKTISIVVKKNIKIFAAGRTDTGVHAKGLVVSFQLENLSISLYRLVHSANALLPNDISVLGALEMPENFHARYSCTSREYEYWIVNSKQRLSLLEGRAYRVHTPLDFEMIREEIKELEGKHFFTSFAKKTSTIGKTTERMIHKIEFQSSNEWKGLTKMVIWGSGFLHNMVRILLGTILDRGSGKVELSIRDILISENRQLAGKTLPPYGLYFRRAYYKDFPEIDSLYDSIL